MDVAKFVAEKIANKELVILCGAGVSFPPPSNMPLARQLVASVLSIFLKELATAFRAIDVRPEVVFHLIAKHENKCLLEVLESLLSCHRHNAIHLFLASMLRQGNNVITSNFDGLIESACANLTDYSLMISGEESVVTSDKPILFKIHGSICSPESLMFTIDHINLGLTEAKKQLLRKLLLDKTLLVLGYSGLDQLDIMPALKEFSGGPVIWLNHETGVNEPRPDKSENEYINRLDNLHYYSVDTELFVNPDGSHNSGFPQPDLRKNIDIQISDRSVNRIYVDILMHCNRYQEAAHFIDSLAHIDDLHLKITRIKIANMFDSGFKELSHANALLVEEIWNAGQEAFLSYFPYIALVSPVDGILEAMQAIDGWSENNTELSYEFYEGLLEAAYKLTLARHYSKAHLLLEKAYRYAEKTGAILLEARTYIILSALVYYQHLEEPDNKRLIEKGLVLCEKAIFILEQDIYHDAFFLEQAKNNYAILLRVSGRFSDAITIYESILDTEVCRNLNAQVHLLYNLSICYFYLGKYASSLKLIDNALALNSEHQREILQGHLFKMKGQIALLKDGNKEDAANFYELALEHFINAGMEVEIPSVYQLLNELT